MGRGWLGDGEGLLRVGGVCTERRPSFQGAPAEPGRADSGLWGCPGASVALVPCHRGRETPTQPPALLGAGPPQWASSQMQSVGHLKHLRPLGHALLELVGVHRWGALLWEFLLTVGQNEIPLIPPVTQIVTLNYVQTPARTKKPHQNNYFSNKKTETTSMRKLTGTKAFQYAWETVKRSRSKDKPL